MFPDTALVILSVRDRGEMFPLFWGLADHPKILNAL